MIRRLLLAGASSRAPSAQSEWMMGPVGRYCDWAVWVCLIDVVLLANNNSLGFPSLHGFETAKLVFTPHFWTILVEFWVSGLPHVLDCVSQVSRMSYDCHRVDVNLVTLII